MYRITVHSRTSLDASTADGLVKSMSQTVIAEIPTGMTLLAGLEAKGHHLVPVGCRGGGCGVCRVKVLSGDYERKKMSRTHVSEADEAEGITLSCRTLPQSDLVIELATPPTILRQQLLRTATTNNNPSQHRGEQQ